jgi:hypothetical protein
VSIIRKNKTSDKMIRYGTTYTYLCLGHDSSKSFAEDGHVLIDSLVPSFFPDLEELGPSLVRLKG